MRKFLLATTALFGFVASGAAFAATAPLTVNVGGDVDFLAANFSGSDKGTTGAGKSSNRSFESLYNIAFDIKGKANNGVEYGGMLRLSNTPDIQNLFNSSDTPYLSAGYVWMSGAFGKVQLGNSHGATDIAVNAPVAGEGQVFGRYMDFIATSTFAKNFIAGIDGTEHSTNVTYFTPKVGNENHKVQIGVSYVPQFYNYGSLNGVQTGQVITNQNGSVGTTNKLSPYRDVIKGAVAYEGKFAPVAVKASATVINGSSSAVGGSSAWIANADSTRAVQDFTSYGFGAQAAMNGFTFGASYTDQGRYNAVVGQDKRQDQVAAGLKYDFSKASVGVSYLGGRGYGNHMSTGVTGITSTSDYVKDFYSYGAGGSYVWAPGLTSSLDGVRFTQKTESSVKNDGYVLLVSQKLAF